MQLNSYRPLTSGLLVSILIACGHEGMSAEKLDADLSTTLPIGVDQQRVVTALDSMRIEHSNFDPGTKTITGIVRDVSRTATTRRAIQLVFIFDEQAKLRTHTAKDVFTGL